ncbi:class I SAM-dependent RNA methyltransferase [Sphingomonas sp.]|uniref:class I SAM-dependent RNA methyltransferase n=1 Tax=Sphingomonas sp. TaxID=28214 RepID=UPI002DD68837|nr:class I SAM-dependent RNA methyltransferase [Sphingomonas sp.]
MPDETIIRIAAKGDGVTESGRHAPLTAPGDMLREDGGILPGPHRRVPPCRHFSTCGGCQLQQLDDASYAAFVHDRVSGAIAGQGLAAPVRAPLVSAPHTRRRATLHAEKRGRQVRIGFTETGSHQLVDLTECHVLLPELFALVTPLRRLLVTALRDAARIDVHLARIDQGVEVVIGGAVGGGLAAAEALTGFAQDHRLARLAIDEGYGAEIRWEPQPATITLGGVPVAFPPASFLQATADGEAALVAAVREAVGEPAATADLFAGLGTFALALPGKVYAAEAGRDTILALKATGRVFAEHRDLFRRPLIPAELDRFDAVVLDPPRAGAREQVGQLAQARTPRIAYVSCNPGSFARDAKLLVDGGYRLDWVQPVGQFTWSTHVELAAAFSR